MREARRADFWRRANQRQYPTRIQALEFRNVKALGSGEIGYQGAISVICGANGVGKSTLIDTTLGALGWSKSQNVFLLKRRLQGATLNVKGELNGQRIEINAAFDEHSNVTIDNELDVPVTHIDSSALAASLTRWFAKTTNLDELLESLEPHVCSKEELDEIAFLIGRRYERCEIYEIEDMEGMDAFPYFRVTIAGINYGSERMGLGELSLLLILWHLRRCQNESIVLLEEPETHVAPRSREATMDVLAKYTTTKGLWSIVTTHSAEIVSRVPSDHITLIGRNGADVYLIPGPTEQQLYIALGMTIPTRGILIVEDRGAREFLQTLLTLLLPVVARGYEIRTTRTESDISAVLKNLPNSDSGTRVVGVFDGDQRQKLDAEGSEATMFLCPYICLPGISPPEILMRGETLHGAGRLSELLGVDADAIKVALSHCEGMDHHDWLEEIARAIGVSYENMTYSLTRLWVENNEAAAIEFIEKLRSICGEA